MTVLEGLDVEAYLRAGGVTDADIEAIEARLLESRVEVPGSPEGEPGTAV